MTLEISKNKPEHHFGIYYFKGTGHFFETLSVGSVPSTDHFWIYAFLINNRFQAKKRIYMPVPA